MQSMAVSNGSGAQQHDHGDSDTLPLRRLRVTPYYRTKVLYLIRHGQGFHNVAGHTDHELYKSWDYFDSHLTAFGWQQAEALTVHIARRRIAVDVIVVSPLTRALETAVGAFGGVSPWQPHMGAALMLPTFDVAGRSVARDSVAANGCPRMIACELCREHIGVHPCDKRRSISHYRSQFPAVDFSHVKSEEDVLWKSDHRETRDEIKQRGLQFIDWILKRPEQHIAVVSHSSFLHFMLSNFGSDADPRVAGELHRWFENCEMRVVTVVDDGAEAPAAADSFHFAGGHHHVDGFAGTRPQ